MAVAISSGVLAAILAHAAGDPAREVCGLLLGTPDRIAAARPVANVAAEPARRFELDPAGLFAAHRAARAGGPAVIGHYHSHPGGRAVPSACDAAEAHDADALWIVVGGGEATAWRPDGKGGFDRMLLTVGPSDGCVSHGEWPQERP